MQELSAYERETIINFNESEKTASVYTCNKALIKKLSELAKERTDMTVEKIDEDCASFIVPKKWIKINANRILSDEERSARSERMRSMKLGEKSN